jgi:hypothetical protein
LPRTPGFDADNYPGRAYVGFALQAGWLGYDALGALDGSPLTDHYLGVPMCNAALPNESAEVGEDKMTYFGVAKIYFHSLLGMTWRVNARDFC